MMATMATAFSEESDDELIGKAGAGDRAAFSMLVDRHYAFIHRVAWRCLGNRTDAEDVAQEVCIRLARSLREFERRERFTTWLYALTLNAGRDALRKAGRDMRKADAYALHLVTDAGEEPGADAAEALWEAVRSLPDKQREAVLLVYGEGLGHAEASDVMGIAEATVSWHIHEAKKRLKVLLRQAGEGGS